MAETPPDNPLKVLSALEAGKYEVFYTAPKCVEERIADVGPVDRTKELFDLNGHYVRKVSLSWLDRSIDNMSDWQSLVKRLNEVDKLLIVDDRISVENPILNEYDRYTKQRYLDDRAVAGIAPERVVDAAQYGLQLFTVFAILAGLVVRIDSHAVHVCVPFDLSFAGDTYLPCPRFSRPDAFHSRKDDFRDKCVSFCQRL